MLETTILLTIIPSIFDIIFKKKHPKTDIFSTISKKSYCGLQLRTTVVYYTVTV